MALINFFTKGRVAIKVSTETTKNHTSCSQTGAWHSAAISAARAPNANQIQVKLTVETSSTMNAIMAASQMMFMLLPPVIMSKNAIATLPFYKFY